MGVGGKSMASDYPATLKEPEDEGRASHKVRDEEFIWDNWVFRYSSQAERWTQAEIKAGRTKMRGQAGGMQMGGEVLLGKFKRNLPDAAQFGLWNLFPERAPWAWAESTATPGQTQATDHSHILVSLLCGKVSPLEKFPSLGLQVGIAGF